MRTLIILPAWIGIVALVFGVGFGPAGLLQDPSAGTLGLALLGAAAAVAHHPARRRG